MSENSRTRPRGGSHLMSRSLAKRFSEFRETGDAGFMEGLDGVDDLPPDQSEVRFKGAGEQPQRKQVPARKNKGNV